MDAVEAQSTPAPGSWPAS